jgi:hypothetical protein
MVRFTKEGTMHALKRQMNWLQKHAKKAVTKGKKGWKCRKTGRWIQSASVYRSFLLHRDFPSGKEVRVVEHLFCPGCNPEPKLPRPGSPVYETDLVTIQGMQ